MSFELLVAAAALCAYLLDSVSFALVVSRLRGIADPRTYGSGNPGATNVLRSGDRMAAVFTLLGDAAHPMYPIGSNGASQAILDAEAMMQALQASSFP